VASPSNADERSLVEAAQMEAAQMDPARFADLYEAVDRVYAYIKRRVRDRRRPKTLLPRSSIKRWPTSHGLNGAGLPSRLGCCGSPLTPLSIAGTVRAGRRMIWDQKIARRLRSHPLNGALCSLSWWTVCRRINAR
jgi:hypothetical protein